MTRNILLIEDSSQNIFGGGQKVSIDVARALSGNFNIFLADSGKDNLFQENIQKYIKQMLYISPALSFKPSSFLSKALFFPFTLIFNLTKTILFLRRNKLKPENTVVLSTTKPSLWLAYMLHIFYGFKFIHHLHNIDYKKSVLHKLALFPTKYASIVLCVSKSVQKQIPHTNTRVLYNPMPIQPHTEKTMSGKIIISSLSNLISWKGIEYFMQSYNFLKNKDRVEYRIYGSGPLKTYLRKYENERVRLCGFAKDTNEIFKTSHIIVIPSTDKEACPMVALEALSFGIPVITTDIGGQAEIISEKTGFKVPIKDPKSIAQKIDYYIENPNEYAKASKKAWERSLLFDKNSFDKSLNDMIQNI